MQTLKLQEWIPKTKIWCITFNKKNSRKTINTVFPAANGYPQNKKINFVIFYNDLCIPLNSNNASSKDTPLFANLIFTFTFPIQTR